MVKGTPINCPSKEKKLDRRLLEQHHIYYGCRRAYDGQFDAEKFRKHKENCLKGRRYTHSGPVMVVDIASLGISSASDSEYVSLQSHPIVEKVNSCGVEVVK